MNSTVVQKRQPPSPREFLAPRHPSSARAVSSFVPRLTRKAFEKYGFASTALLTDWASIVGADLASYTAPERLKWPRRVDGYAEIGEGDERRPGATLIVRVDGPRAIELQHKAHQIIDRINASFGYRAVAELRFIQAPLEGTSTTARRPNTPRKQMKAALNAPELASIQDEALRTALARLEASIRGEASR